MLRRLAPAGLRAATAVLHGTPVPMEPALVGAAQCWRAAAPTAAPLHTAAAALASVQVTIPALGESISDGTVAAVLKQVGDLVAEDEAIVQIETDKVTVDVRSPRAGVVLAVLVKPDDNVEVGHLVATVGDSASDSAVGAVAAAATQQQQQHAAAPAASKAAAPASEAAAAPPPPSQQQQQQHRTPAIRFPPRRTPSGKAISSLPKEQAAALLAALLSGGGAAAAGDSVLSAAAAAAAAGFTAEEFKNMIAVPIVGGSRPILRGPPVPTGPPGPARRTLTDAEMERVMLGGADP